MRKPLSVVPGSSISELVFQGEGPDLIAPGEYEAVGKVGQVFWHGGFRRWCLVIRFDVLVPAADAEHGFQTVELEAFYNVEKIGNRVQVRPRSNYARDWGIVSGRRMSRFDRPHAKAFIGALCLVKVVTVDTNANQERLHATGRYSKVARILERRAGGVRE